MARNILFLNNRNITTDFFFVVHNLTGWPGNLGSASRDVPVLEGPEISGAMIDPRLLRIQPARVTLAGRFETSSLAAAMIALDALRGMLGEGEVRVRTIYAPDRECLAILQSHEGGVYQKRFINGRVAASFNLIVKDGVAFRLQPDGYALSTARTACPIGTAYSDPVIILHGGGGSLTNPVITVRNTGGDIVQTMGFTVALGTTEFLRIDSSRTSVDRVTSGIPVNGTGLWTSGDFVKLRPADALVEGGAYATVELSASVGTATGEITYSRRYR